MSWCVGADASGPPGRLSYAENPRGSGRLYPELTSNLKAGQGRRLHRRVVRPPRCRLRIARIAGSKFAGAKAE